MARSLGCASPQNNSKHLRSRHKTRRIAGDHALGIDDALHRKGLPKCLIEKCRSTRSRLGVRESLELVRNRDDLESSIWARLYNKPCLLKVNAGCIACDHERIFQRLLLPTADHPPI